MLLSHSGEYPYLDFLFFFWSIIIYINIAYTIVCYLQQIPDTEQVILAGDLNGHIGASREEFERWHGGNRYGEMNEEGRVILQCAQMFDLAICNTFFNKKDEHLITYRSGNTASVIDYILVRRDNLFHVRDCKVIPGESVATQHRLLLMEIDIQMPRKTKPRHREKKIKWWNLKKDEYKMKFVTSMSDESWCDMEYKDVENRILDIAKSKLGESCPGGRYVEKETW